MASIYLGGTFYQFTADQVRTRQALIEDHLIQGITVHKPKHRDDYNPDLGANRDQTLTMRDKYMVKNSDLVVLDIGGTERPPRGILIEVGWASALDIPILLIIDPDSPHHFNMLTSLCTWQVATHKDAIHIINAMFGG
jgi:nucleoside 2-deoxyribosyltransferase